MPDEENVKVAVRVRPFNSRENGRGAKLIVAMDGASTILTNPENPEEKKTFAFDHSYWSFDGVKTDENGYCSPDTGHKNGKKYCDQKKVFDDVGQGILDNAWEGFNTSLFAYGQTGSGKSYSIIGYGPNKGVVPQFCDNLFQGIESKKGNGTTYEVKFSMLEIYNEVAQDLLEHDEKKKKKGLKIRQHPKKGFYADGLIEVMVGSYAELDAKMDEGTLNRTVASTNMNATSSRAHTIVGINFVQKSVNAAGEEMAKGAVVNLVDLAGSERVDATGATGDRLKEGASINQSLSCLGNVIHALAEVSEGKKARVPYRDSVLTRLLQNALGGNSKTVMIAAISPADINYDESLSTLRYADRAKQIKTKAVVNEDPVEAMIRDLKAENERLLAQLASGVVNEADLKDMSGKDSMSAEELESMKKEWKEEMTAQMAGNDKELDDMKLSYEEKLKAAQSANVDHTLQKITEDKKTKPHLYNLNYDPQLSCRIIHILEKPETEIGNKRGHESDVCMVGPGIQNQHAIIKLDGDKVKIRPFKRDCKILVNGSPIAGEMDLEHNDRMVFGSTHMWVFQNPKEPGIATKKYPPITYDYAQEEIASRAGLNLNSAESTDLAGLQEDLIDVMPAVEEANSISEELDKKTKFELLLVSPNMLSKMNHKPDDFDGRDKLSNRPEVCVKMKNLEKGTEFVWPKEKFLNRLYLMKEMYQNYEEEEDDWDLPEDKDPFQEDSNQVICIGSVKVNLSPIAYCVEMSEQLDLVDLKGNKVGIVNVDVIPCNAKGKELHGKELEDAFVDQPHDLVGKECNFQFKVQNCRGLPGKYTDLYCTYTMYTDKDVVATKKVSSTSNPDFNHSKVFAYKVVTPQLIKYLESEGVEVRLMGKQVVKKAGADGKMTTKEMLKLDRSVFSKTASLMNGFQINGRHVDPQKQSTIVELLLVKKTQARLGQKCDNVKKMLEKAGQLNHSRISTNVIQSFFNATSEDQMKSAMKQLEG